MGLRCTPLDPTLSTAAGWLRPWLPALGLLLLACSDADPALLGWPSLVDAKRCTLLRIFLVLDVASPVMTGTKTAQAA
eukprot:1161103-Pelagomonas_calceolata.AAC.8